MRPEPDDRELMLRYRDGDAGAFDLLYSRHKGGLYRYLLRQSRHPATAEELFQEVWIRVVRARHRYRATARFTTWLYQVAHNCLVDRIRHERRRGGDPADDDPAELDGGAGDGTAEAAAAAQTAQRLEAALAALPAEQREAFLLREEGGLGVDEIAAATGVPREAAKSRLRYAVRKLRAAIEGGT